MIKLNCIEWISVKKVIFGLYDLFKSWPKSKKTCILESYLRTVCLETLLEADLGLLQHPRWSAL